MRLTIPVASLVVLVALGALASVDAEPSQEQARRQDPAAAKLAQVADAALATVERTRGVRLVEDVARRVSSPAAVRAYLAARVRSEYPPEVIALEETRYRRLGLLPADVSLEDALLTGFTANIAGFYDPEARALHIAEGMTGAMLRPVLIHEWTHAVQHERLDIERLMRRVRGNGDYGAAVVALLEGEAMAVSLAATLPAPPPGGTDAGGLSARLAAAVAALDGRSFEVGMPDLPRVFVEELRFVYVAGLAAVLAAWKDGGWAAVERWQGERPPLSTEHVLHPERAFGPARDCPQALTLPDLAGVLPPGARVSDTETLGEAGWRAFLRVHLGAVGDKAAAGWDGDVYAAVSLGLPEEGRAPALLVMSVWDSPDEAEELEDALRAAGRLALGGGGLPGAAWERRGAFVAGWIGDEPPPDRLLDTLLSKTRAREVCDHLAFESARRGPDDRGAGPSQPKTR